MKDEPAIFLFDSDAEFRSLSYDCYANLVKKIPSVKGNTEEVFNYIKEYKDVKTTELDFDFTEYHRIPKIVSWIEDTYNKYNINLINFAEGWCDYFCSNEHLWDRKKKSDHGPSSYYWYDYQNSKTPFNVGSLYTKMNYKPFIKGKRKELEALILLYWFKSIEEDKSNYIDNFINKNFCKKESIC